MAAFALSRYQIPLRRTLILLMLGGNLLPPQILLVPVAKLSQVFGLYDSLTTLIAVEVGFGLGFYVFVLQGFMRTIPAEIQQAALPRRRRAVPGLLADRAAADPAGAGRARRAVVHLDLQRPAVADHGADHRSRRCRSPRRCSACRDSIVSYWNVIAAGSVIAAIPTVAVFLRFQRHFIAGLNLGAVK